jgi:ATP-binding cassette subfamily B protein
MPTWAFVWQLIRFQPRRFLYNTVAFSSLMLGWLVPGWISREFFNLITAEAPATFGFWTLMALLVASALGRMASGFGIVHSYMPFTDRTQTLLHKNMLGRILELPGAAALPESPGAAISRFREDVNELPWFALWINNVIGFGMFAAVAVTIMWSINPTMTLVAFTPLTIIVLAANAGTRRIERYRTATRQTGSAVTDLPTSSLPSLAPCRRSKWRAPKRASFSTLIG